jgi:hypothetical protein
MLPFHKKFTFLFIVFILLVNISGCVHKLSDNDFSTIAGVNVQHYLNIINLSKSPVRPNTTITLEIANETLDCVVFPYNFGVKIFIFQNKGWVEIPDNIEYADHYDIVLAPRGRLDADTLVAIRPDYTTISTLSKGQVLRIVLIGSLCINGTPSNQTTADYIDLSIEP